MNLLNTLDSNVIINIIILLMVFTTFYILFLRNGTYTKPTDPVDLQESSDLETMRIINVDISTILQNCLDVLQEASENKLSYTEVSLELFVNFLADCSNKILILVDMYDEWGEMLSDTTWSTNTLLKHGTYLLNVFQQFQAELNSILLIMKGD